MCTILAYISSLNAADSYAKQEWWKKYKGLGVMLNTTAQQWQNTTGVCFLEGVGGGGVPPISL